MSNGDGIGRRLLLAAVLLLGLVLGVGSLDSVTGVGGDGSPLPAFGIEIDVPQPDVSLDGPDGDNGTSSPPGVSPLPVAPDPEPDRSDDGVAMARY
jgi:hypothetical protein